MDYVVYSNGCFSCGAQASISPLDLSVLRGYGVNDYTRTYNRIPYMLDRHIARLFTSARTVQIEPPIPHSMVKKITYDLIERMPGGELGIKFLITGGISDDQFLPGTSPQFVAAAYPHVPFPSWCYEQGVKLPLEIYERSFPTAKTTQYLPAVVAMSKAAEQGFIDVLFTSRSGDILESTTANFFAIIDDTFLTPSKGVLKGITRDVVIEISGAKEEIIHRSQIPLFDGAFLTSSNKEIMPVTQIGGQFINNGKIPKSIIKLMEQFNSNVNLQKII